jgi:hypothetical protein
MYMQAITDPKNLPPEARVVYEEVEQLGFAHSRYFAGARMPDLTRRVQVRPISQLAPPLEVSKYAQAYARDEKLPPVIITRDWYLVDGATRVSAAIKAGKSVINLVQIQVDFEGAAKPVQDRIIALGLGFNNTHGRRMRDADIADLIAGIITEGESAKSLAARLHLPESTVAGVFSLQRGRKRLEELKVDVEGLKSSHIKSLGSKTWLTNPLFVKLAELTRDAHLTVAELGEISAQLATVPTEQGRLKLLDGERASRSDRIRGIPTRPGRAGQVRRALGHILKVEDSPDSAVEMDQEAADRYLSFLIRSRSVLDKIISAQTAVERARADVAEPKYGYGR